MSRLPSSKTAKIWAERIAHCERSSTPVAQFCQSINCSPTSFYQWKRNLPAHLPREIVEVAIPEDVKKRIESGEMILIRESILESLKFVLPKLVVVEYREPVLAFANTPDQEIPVQGEANLGDKGRYHPSVAAQIVNGKFGMHLPY
jgi:hypothetical protein